MSTVSFKFPCVGPLRVPDSQNAIPKNANEAGPQVQVKHSRLSDVPYSEHYQQ